MSKSTRSVSLPARAQDRAVNQLVNSLDKGREVKTVLKNDGKRSLEKENEIEVNSTLNVKKCLHYYPQEHYGRSSLSFRVDQVTVKQRLELMERQKMIADNNINNEINSFNNLLKVELSEIFVNVNK